SDFVRSILGGATLSSVISTHYDEDHLGGLLGVIADARLVGPQTVVLDRGIPGGTLSLAIKRGRSGDPVSWTYRYSNYDKVVTRDYCDALPKVVAPAPTLSPPTPARVSAVVLSDDANYTQRAEEATSAR